MTEQETFIAADQAFTRVVDKISDAQWDIPVPSGMPGATVRDVLHGHTTDDRWVQHVLSGATIEDGKALFPDEPAADQPAALKTAWMQATAKAQRAVREFSDLDKIVHLSFGDYTAQSYLQQITGYRGLQAWDLARAIGADDTLPDDLVRGLWEQLEPVAEEWRAMGVFGPRVEVADDASLQDRLLGLAGRHP